MYYIVVKSGMYLSAFTKYSQTWYLSENHAMKFFAEEHALEVAMNCEGSVLSRVTGANQGIRSLIQ